MRRLLIMAFLVFGLAYEQIGGHAVPHIEIEKPQLVLRAARKTMEEILAEFKPEII